MASCAAVHQHSSFLLLFLLLLLPSASSMGCTWGDLRDELCEFGETDESRKNQPYPPHRDSHKNTADKSGLLSGIYLFPGLKRASEVYVGIGRKWLRVRLSAVIGEGRRKKTGKQSHVCVSVLASRGGGRREEGTIYVAALPMQCRDPWHHARKKYL